MLTYWGFTSRKLGDVEAAMAWYDAALAANPDNLLARAYRGMAYVEMGDLTLARAELEDIWERGGAGGWPEAALAQAIATGVGVSY